MKEKGRLNRAQVSIFIIFAIIIVVVAGLAYVISRNASQSKVDNEFFKSAAIKPSIDKIKSNLEDCMKKTAKDALFTIGIQGGYYKEPKEVYSFGWMFIPYYYKEDLFLMPAKDEIESELSNYVDDKLTFCLDNIDIGDFKLDYKKSKTKTIINPGQIIFNIDIPVSLSKEDKLTKFELKDAPVSQDSKLFEILEVAKYINDANKNNPRSLCISCLSQIIEEKNLIFDTIELDDNIRLYVLTENNDSPYSFEFLEKYKGGIVNVKPQ